MTHPLRQRHRPALIAMAIAVLTPISAVRAECRYALTATQMMFQIEEVGGNVRIVPVNHGVHYTIPTDWDILLEWRDPYPTAASASQTISLGISAAVQHAGGGAVGAAIKTYTTGTAIWHVVHQGNAPAGRSGSTGQIYNNGDTSVYDLCKSNDAKPQVLIDIYLEDGGSTKVHLARYIYSRQDGGTTPPGPGGPAISGAILATWNALGGMNGLGKATTAEANAAPSPFGTQGRYQQFQNGLIIWASNGRAAGQAFGVWGGILSKYLSIGGTRSFLGFPLSSEKDARPSPFGTQGRFNQFENGYIVWARNGRYANHSFIVQGAIATLYNALGGSASWLGFPISDEMDYNGGRRSLFEGGSIVWTRQAGAKAIRN